MPNFGKPLRNADISPSQKAYVNSVILNLEDRLVEYPECYYLIEWFTQAKYNDNGTWKYAAEKTWQRGENLLAAIEGLDIGLTVNDSFFDLWFNVDAHPARQLLTNENGEVLSCNGEPLIG